MAFKIDDQQRQYQHLNQTQMERKTDEKQDEHHHLSPALVAFKTGGRLTSVKDPDLRQAHHLPRHRRHHR